ncbi:MAG: redoxin domain-containing protein [Acidobacteriota bacterium]
MKTERWGVSCLLFLALGLATVTASCQEGPTAAGVRLLDLKGREVRPLQLATGAEATVFLFTRADCPISNRYAPEVERLFEKFSPHGVAFYLVYLDREEPTKVIRQHVRDYGYRTGVLRDPEHRLADLTGAEVTPEAAVFVKGGKMVYRGRIDDRYVDFGRARAEPRRRDLELALEDIMGGRPVKISRTRAVGCFIADLR